MRAERGLRKHLDECVKCRLAAGELAHVNAGIPALLPVAVIGWFAAGYVLKAAGVVAGGVAGAGVAGAAAAATGAGASAGAGASSGGASSAAVAEGLGIPAKAGIAAVAAVAATAGLVWALTGSEPQPVAQPAPEPTVAAPVDSAPPAAKPAPKPTPAPPAPSAQPSSPVAPAARPSAPAPTPSAKPSAKPAPTPTPSAKPSPRPTSTPQPTPTPTPTPTPSKPTPPTTPPAPPAVFPLNQLEYGVSGDGTKPEVDLARSSWMWRRSDLSINDVRYSGVSVHASSSLHIDLNRQCTRYDALAGIDDLTAPLKQVAGVRFAVYADGQRLWRSAVVRPGDSPVPVRVGIGGRRTLQLVVEPHTKFGRAVVADWAASRISCA
ncbi:hypothetical protein SLA_3962 [Streptomyces laurentii]|uniref:Glycosyl hydrolase family 98 putative carbohydrate-binding module domain-containing protein n=1 Tax=Streptomyces laurentii TaxID=39478 RepID=A0A160P1Y0_STRLU|nr:hypothetical protein SLA_3962 [Streptomyces laurentii]